MGEDNDSALTNRSSVSGNGHSPLARNGTAPILVTQGVSKSFGGVMAADGVDFVIGAGECVGLVGPNGAGKTTIFNCICGQVRPDSGTVRFKGQTLDRLPTFKRARLGIGRTYQRIEIFPDLTVEQHLLVAERARRGDGRLWKDLLRRSRPVPDELDAVHHVLELVDLLDVRSRPVSALGLGTCRLVELARALVGQPDLLMADEPSSGLDVHETRELAHVLRSLQQEHGMAVLLVEHDLGMVGDVVDRAVVMDLGRVIADGTFDDVMGDPAVRQAYLGDSA